MNLLELRDMHPKPFVRETWPARRQVPVRLELFRHGQISDPVHATIIRWSEAGVELRLNRRLQTGQKLWLALELGDEQRWTTRRWQARVGCISPSPKGWLVILHFHANDHAPRLSHHVVREDGRIVSYRFDRSWHSEPTVNRDAPRSGR